MHVEAVELSAPPDELFGTHYRDGMKCECDEPNLPFALQTAVRLCGTLCPGAACPGYCDSLEQRNEAGQTVYGAPFTCTAGNANPWEDRGGGRKGGPPGSNCIDDSDDNSDGRRRLTVAPGGWRQVESGGPGRGGQRRQLYGGGGGGGGEILCYFGLRRPVPSWLTW